MAPYFHQAYCLKCMVIFYVNYLFELLQLTMTFCIATIRFTKIFYSTVISGLEDYRSILVSMPFFVGLLCSIYTMCTTAHAAQQLQNSASALTRSLRLLLVRTHADDSEQRDIKQLLHIVSTRPIRIQAFGAINVNMRLIPACLALVVSHTVVALQFNNVI